MFRGCIAHGKIGPLIEVATTMNSNEYISNILERFLPFWKRFKRKHRTFMQDNAPCHKAKNTISWFGKKRIPLLTWPPQSPDINPIENVWELLMTNVRKKQPQPRNLAELRNYLIEKWGKLSVQQINKLIESLPKDSRKSKR